MTAGDINLIIAGATARSAAASAIRAGYRPWCADLFADVDLHAIAPAVAFERGQYPHALMDMIARTKLPAGIPILLTGAMENHLDAIRPVLARHPILGPDEQAIRQLRKVVTTPSLQPAIQGVGWCDTFNIQAWRDAWRWRRRAIRPSHRWIAKPARSGGGIAVRMLRPWSKITSADRIQRFITGDCLGVLWRGQAHSCELLGVTRQVIGDKRFHTAGAFQYTGSLGPITLPDALMQALASLGEALWRQCPFQGLLGGDVILDAQGQLWPVEFNPRYTASVEVLERACDFAALEATSAPKPANGVTGKAYVYAPCDGILPDLRTLYAPAEVADISTPGSPVFARQPVCSLLACAADEVACLDRLHEMAQRLYTRLRESGCPR